MNGTPLTILKFLCHTHQQVRTSPR